MLALLGGLLAFWLLGGALPGDAYTYLAAGQRLNAGHLLYAISPGDSEVLLNPPFWTVPLLSPPLVGVIWRPLALLPADAGVYVWWLAVALSSGAVIAALVARAPLVAVPLMLGLSIPIVVQVGVANIDGLLLLGIVSVWWLTIRGHERAAGVIVGIMTAVKVTPVVLLWWLVALGRWRGAQAWAMAIAVCLAVGVLGAGLSSHLRFLEIAAQTAATGSTEGSLAGIARGFGVAPELARYLPSLAMGVGAALMLVWRGRPGLAFGIASVLMVIGSPSVSVHTPALLLATLAPFAWPLSSKATVTEPQPEAAAMAPLVA
jgi:alpha-1,2-mannosyltransferase